MDGSYREEFPSVDASGLLQDKSEGAVEMSPGDPHVRLYPTIVDVGPLLSERDLHQIDLLKTGVPIKDEPIRLFVRLLTPGHIAVLFFVHMYLQFRCADEDRLQTALLLKKYMEADSVAISSLDLNDFRIQMAGLRSSDYTDLYLSFIVHIFHIDNLHSYFENMEAEFYGVEEEGDEPLLDSDSLVGKFIRFCYIEFARLSQFERDQLWNGFKHFREPALPDILSHFEFSMVHSQIEHPTGEAIKYLSMEDFHRLIDSQVKLMQKTGTCMSGEVVKVLNEMAAIAPSMPATYYYVVFLHAWRSGDYNVAIANLYHYFDLLRATEDHPKYFFQYALLNLAVVQADFQCISEANSAIRECIQAAREANDQQCLKFATAWYLRFKLLHRDRYSTDMDSEHTTFRFLKSRVKDSSPSLLSTSYVIHANSMAYHGEPLIDLLECLCQTMHVISVDHNLDGFGTAMNLKSAAFHQMGVGFLRDVYDSAAHSVVLEHEVNEEALRSEIRSAYSIGMNGEYERAFEILATCYLNAVRSRNSFNYYRVYNFLLSLNRAMRGERYAVADYLYDELLKLTGNGGDSELRVEVQMTMVKYWIMKNDFERAEFYILEAINDSNFYDGDHGSIAVYYNMYLDLCRLSGRPFAGFESTLHLAAMSLRAKRLHAMITVVFTIVEQRLQTRDYGLILSLYDRLMPVLLATEHTENIARAYYQLCRTMMAKCQLTVDCLLMAQGDEGRIEEIQSGIAKAVNFALSSMAAYQKLEDLTKLSELHHLINILTEPIRQAYPNERENFLERKYHIDLRRFMNHTDFMDF
ncbi:anaphase-promoting complex subunit 5-domain-containing protein [Lipomyces oligophaga]|uniref:anaphase-promoting complex subunit 5-domain-containing protein n=1 Tax=Lipomyces oligophaga TaxID=45792 RepID=UPI0034CE6357